MLYTKIEIVRKDMELAEKASSVAGDKVGKSGEGEEGGLSEQAEVETKLETLNG